MESGIVFLVNGKEVEKIDPLMLGDSKTELFSDEKYKILIKERGVKDFIKAKVAILPDFPPKMAKMLGIGTRQQGFYVVRNNREIASGKTLDLFVRHNDLNRVRIELLFSGALDEEMGVNFIKQNITPNQQIIDKIREEIMGQINTIRKRIIKSQPRNEENEFASRCMGT